MLVLLLVLSSLSMTGNGKEPQPHDPSGNSTGSVGCLAHERDALQAFAQGITSDPAGRLDSWHRGVLDCCRWRGVRCSKQTGHVVGLHLANANTQEALSGQISTSLLSLQHLQHLDLSKNNLSGPTSRVPEFLGILKNLRYLNLHDMPFYGMVPPQLGNLSKLHTLYLSPANYFYMDTPNLYSTDISWLKKLPLRNLSLASVNLSTQVHWATVVNMVPSLKFLDLSGCSLTSANQSLPHLNITDLEELRLSFNDFDHPIRSCWFWNLTSLQYLDLFSTYLYGKIPDALGDMTSLQFLDLSYSRLTDIMTANMRNMCNLESLYLSSSELNGDIIELLELLPQCFPNKLKEVSLAGNNLTGELPNWIGRRWPSLCTLELYSNQLKGPIPTDIGMLNNLNYLDLNNNNLDGLITQEHLARLTSLFWIDLSCNSLQIVVEPEGLPAFKLVYANFASCRMGPLFPSWLQSQTDIFYLNITGASIADRLPEWFFTTFPNAWTVDISNNGISGTLPTNFANMTSLEEVYLNSNNLYGPIPQLPTTLSLFVGSKNSFSGPLPSNFGAQQLQHLNIASNRITGRIPQSICQLKELEELNIANNLLDGEFPLCFQSRGIRRLILRNNKISGKFPSSLKAWMDLYILDLAWNKFSGKLPLWIGDFAQLRIAELSHNRFIGSIPATITRLGSLTYLSLAGNCISGPLPLHLSNLTGMTRGAPTRLDSKYPMSYYDNLNLSVITKRQERYYKDGEVYEMVSIDLSLNQLTGKIPEEITSLDGVINLNLSWNQLSGKIPGRIGLMHLLESLDLKENKLYGEIPRSMSNLTYLSVLDLSYNNLTGRIPSGGQLDTLYQQNPSIYDGNNGLCGHPLPKNCSDNSKPNHGDQMNNEGDSMFLSFSFGLGLGYVVGLWAVFCIMLFKKSWRIAHFRLFDKAYDKAFVFVFVSWSRWAQKIAAS